MRVELNKKSLFALASDTRLKILKSLNPKRRTVTQISETVGIDKAAVHRHLQKLAEGGLVKRYEDHGFIYYGLSWKARDIISPSDNTKIVILFSCSWLMTFGAIFFVVLGMVGLGVGDASNAIGMDPGDLSTESPNQPTYYDNTSRQDNTSNESKDSGAIVSDESLLWIIPTASFVFGAAALLMIGFRTLRKPKQAIKAN